MKKFSRWLILLTALILLLAGGGAAAVSMNRQRMLLVSDQEDETIYAKIPISEGDQVEFDWIHSFEHIPWYEYYTVKEDGSFLLDTIKVAGYGAGIPAEMDVETRIEDGMVVMENIGSEFPEFRFFNSETALQSIKVNGEEVIRGEDMPHHARILVAIGE